MGWSTLAPTLFLKKWGYIILEQLKNNLGTIRRDYHITQQQLADAVGISPKTVYSLETERSQPTLLVALRLSHYLKCPLDKLFNYIPDDNIKPLGDDVNE